ncbi:MAG: hypothetical protein ACI4WG_00295 [Erysipelotrichaceae bacterium]
MLTSEEKEFLKELNISIDEGDLSDIINILYDKLHSVGIDENLKLNETGRMCKNILDKIAIF